jgi:hypothetical protein
MTTTLFWRIRIAPPVVDALSNELSANKYSFGEKEATTIADALTNRWRTRAVVASPVSRDTKVWSENQSPKVVAHREESGPPHR